MPDTRLSITKEEIEDVEDVDVVSQMQQESATTSNQAAEEDFPDDPEYVEDQLQDTTIQSPCEESSDEEVELFTRGPLGNKFMDTKQIIELMKASHVLLTEIPKGRKDGMYFLLDNCENIQRRQHNDNSEFWDDIGAWAGASSPATLFTQVNGKLISVKLVKIDKNDETKYYCTERRINKEKVNIPLDPQPLYSDVLQVHRLYQTLVASQKGTWQFRRRITWLMELDYLPDNAAVVEYVGGNFPDTRSYHGNTKNSDKNTKYVRTKPTVNKRNSFETGTSKNVERKLNQEVSEDYDKQRNEKQLRNIKYSINREKKEIGGTNAADNIVKVEEMTKTHPFVKSVKHISGLQHPVVTLFTEQQISDIKRFCCKEKGTVLGVDKTYNLGDFHVTPTLSVLKRLTNDHPICFGPTFIHTSSTTKKYSSFFHEIADSLTDAEIPNLVIGSDEEVAFKAAIKRCFPGCTHVLCTRRLKQNANRYIEDEVGISLKDRQDILNSIFGKDGLTNSLDVDVFNTRVERLQSVIDIKDGVSSEKKFRTYFDNKLLPLVDVHVVQPTKLGKIEPNWTSSNSESANHVLKSAVQWKAKDLPKFIEILYGIVNGEEIERVRAIRDMGIFKLAAAFQHHATDIDHWVNISQEQRDKKLKRF